VTIDRRAICPSCKSPMTTEVSYVDPPSDIKASSSSEGGYVKGLITYMVMDNLDVKPMSTISAITLLSKFNVTDVGAVEEKVVDFGMDEVYNIAFPIAFLILCIITTRSICIKCFIYVNLLTNPSFAISFFFFFFGSNLWECSRYHLKYGIGFCSFILELWEKKIQ
jgi:hypothetical protein